MATENLTVIIVSWNTKTLLRDCLAALPQDLLARTYVVDNASGDGSAEMVAQQFPTVNLIANKDNVGFGRANNQVLKNLSTEFVLLLNPDAEVRSGAIEKLMAFMQSHPRTGIVAPQLLNADGSVQRSCRSFPTLANMFYELSGLSRLLPNIKRFRDYKMLDFDHQLMRQVDQPEGACLLIRKKALDQVGIFDEKFFMLFEEVDLCYRIKKVGWEIWFDPESKVVHHYGQSIKQVKKRMIISSHKGMYWYWAKHHRKWYHALSKPLLWAGLVLLALVRIGVYSLKSK